MVHVGLAIPSDGEIVNDKAKSDCPLLVAEARWCVAELDVAMFAEMGIQPLLAQGTGLGRP
jgi:hypothetical protein